MDICCCEVSEREHLCSVGCPGYFLLLHPLVQVAALAANRRNDFLLDRAIFSTLVGTQYT